MTDQKKLKIAIEALKQCTIPSGAYTEDNYQHAKNCLINLMTIAKLALNKIGVDYSDVKIEQ